ncbi:hypothetical protein GF338_03890, partial [candidate division WOR-3 bacterium]|nr:hypothetical protein [candidate division WOR-3 bacterium]
MKTNVEGDSLWVKKYGEGMNDYTSCVHQTTDGGYIMTGYADGDSVQPFAGSRLLLLKVDSLGDTMWVQKWGGMSAGNWVEQTSDGGFMIVGETESFGAGQTDVWLLRTDSLGDTLWTRTFGGEHHDNASSGQQTSDGGFIIAGNLSMLYPT